jgi:hypothetical protein
MENNDYFHDFQFFPSTRISHPVIESTRGGVHMCVWLPMNMCGSEAGHIYYIDFLIIPAKGQYHNF